jgi:hypothetical protein
MQSAAASTTRPEGELTQRPDELVIRAPLLLMQCANLLCSSFRYRLEAVL